MNKSKRKRNRRKERKKGKISERFFKVIGVNAAGLMSKIESFEKLLRDKQPSVFCLQETKLKKPNKIKTESSKHFTIYELLRKNSGGGGLCIGVHKDLRPVWISQGDDEVECLAVEVWLDDFPIRVVTAYGPQLSDSLERKQKFWDFLSREVNNAAEVGAGFILQMDSNSHLGKGIIKSDVNEQNLNGRLFVEFLERNGHLTLVNTLSICEGSITRMRKTKRSEEKSILDVFVTCDKILPYINRMKIDEKREYTLSNYSAIKAVGRVVETDHNICELEVNLVISSIKQERIEMFQFKNQESQLLFKKLTTNTKDFSNCFNNESNFEVQAGKWRKVLDDYFHKSFKKIRVNNKIGKKKCEISELMDKRKVLKTKKDLDEKDEEEIIELEARIAEKCEEVNRKKVMDNFKNIGGNEGNLSHQGVWKVKKKYFPKIKPSLPVGKKNLKGQLITNPEEQKELYLDTFQYRLRQRPAQPGYESYLELQEELFNLRLELARMNETPLWTMNDLNDALHSLKNGKCRDPEGLIREIFKQEVIGDDLKDSLLTMYNKVKVTGTLPSFMRIANISAIYKGKGDIADLDSDRGIFLVSIFRTILMKMIYKDKYDIIEKSMSDSNIGARKRKNIRNHIFVVNCILHDVLSKKSNEPIDIMVLDYKQMFDSECLFECMNDLYEAGIDDNIFNLIYEANRENYVAVKTPNGLSRREIFKKIVMQGDVLAPLLSSLQVDTMGKECLMEEKHLYYYKKLVPIPPLGLVDDLFTISTCGYKTSMMNQFINSKTAMKRLQFGTSKCIKLHVGKSCNETLCKDLFVGGWKVKVETDSVTGNCSREEVFEGDVKMGVKSEQMYLGDVISADGKHTKNIQNRKNKGLGIIDQITSILETVFFGKYFFEIAMVLRSSLFLSSVLLNSEAWVNYTEKDVRSLEQTDEILLNKILGCDSNTSNVLKYLELGIIPVRYEIMKRKILFLQYILKQDKDSMIYKVFEATSENPLNNDFVKTCKKYLKTLDINLTFMEIEEMTNWRFKKLVKEKTNLAGWNYLLGEKIRQNKIRNMQFSELKMQEYLLYSENTNLSKLIFKARSKTLDIKTQKEWKYKDDRCTGCGVKEETGDEILSCEGLGEVNEVKYSWFYCGSLGEMFLAAEVLRKRLKKRQKIIEEEEVT